MASRVHSTTLPLAFVQSPMSQVAIAGSDAEPVARVDAPSAPWVGPGPGEM
jgi:hypothetical protein